jgi:beta-lactamase class A
MERMSKYTRVTLAIAALVSFCATHSAFAQLARLRPLLEQRIGRHQGIIGLSIIDLVNGERLSIRGDQAFPSASVIKLPVLVELFHQIERGPLELSDPILMIASDQKPGSGVLQFLSTPHQLTLRDAATLMIILSDNTATNLVLDKIGIPPVNARMDSLGLKSTRLHSKVFLRSFSVDTAGSRKWGLGVTTPEDIAEILARLYRGQIVSDTVSKTMIGILKNNFDYAEIPRLLPADVSVAHKTGALNASRHDCGIVYSPQRDYVLCILSRENADQTWRLDTEARVTIAELARITHEFMTSQKK